MKKILLVFISCLSVVHGTSSPCWYDGIELGADWLYWKTEQSQMEIGSEIMGISSGGNDLFIHSSVIRLGFRSESGYRIWAGYSQSCWEFAATFTRITSRTTVGVNLDPADINTNFISLFSSNFPILTVFEDINFSSIAAEWRPEINYLDLTMQRTFFLCRPLAICPYFGFRGFWMRQNIKISGSTPSNGGNTFATQLKQCFDGYGLLGGLTARWNVGCGFACIGRIGGSLLYSNIRFTQHLDGVTAGPLLNIQGKDRSHLSTLSIDSFIGLQYSTCYCNIELDVHVGWENHLFFFTDQLGLQSHGALTLQGLTLGAAMDFNTFG